MSKIRKIFVSGGAVVLVFSIAFTSVSAVLAALTLDATNITSNGVLTFAAGGTNQNITLTPSGTGYTILNGNVGIGTASPGALLDLGLAGTTLGVIRLAGSTSGNVSLQPNAVAGTGIVLTLPATTGTIALTSNLAAYLPYTGATADVDLGAHTLKVGNNNVVRSFTKTVCASNSVEAKQCDYLADGTDDQTEINAAITAVNAAGGGTVKLMEGIYSVSNNVILKSNVVLSGDGWGTIIKLANEATLTYAGIIRMKHTIRVTNVAVKNLTIDGNRANQTSDTNKYGVYAECDYCVVENNYIKDVSQYGVDPHEATGGIPTTFFNTINNIIENCGGGTSGTVGTGITYDMVEKGIISGNILKNSPYHAISIVTNSKNILISGNQISTTTTGQGIQVNGGTNITISNNNITWSGDDGIYVSGTNNSERVSIIGNHISYSADNGIRIYKSSHNIISNNYLYQNSQSGGDDGILLDGATTFSTYNVVTGNRINGSNESYGIREKSTSDNYNIISNNIVTGTVTKDISILGANTQLFGNKTDDSSNFIFLDGNVGIGTATPGTVLTVAGPISTNAPTTKTAAYSLTATDSSLIFNGVASITLTLQAASSYPGRILYVKTIAAFTVVSASANVVPVDSATAGTAILAAVAGKWAMLQSNGTNWVVMAGN